MDSIANILRRHNVRKTPVRMEVLEVFLEQGFALSHAEVEQRLREVDRITLYRTLKTFEEAGIIHKAFDGTDKSRYALCSSDCVRHQHEDDHAHFNCKHCGKTFCLDKVEVPEVRLPWGYQQESAHLIIKGICESCVS